MKITKIIGIVLIVAALFGAGFLLFMGNGAKAPITPATPPSPQAQTGPDPKNATYIVAGRATTLVNGMSVVEAVPGAASKIVTQYFGNEAAGDFNGDGLPDVAFLVTQSDGGSGTFYYSVAALRVPETAGYVGTNAVFLGDRIAPQTTNISGNLIMVNYAERKPGEPMTVRPSVGVTKYLIIENGELHELNIDRGYVVMSEGVRTFTPCGSKEALWLVGSSTAYKDIMASYQSINKAPPSQYKPIFSLIVGRKTEKPQDGFGADYNNGYFAFKLLNMSPGESCE